MRCLSRDQRTRVLAALVEGCSVRATVRMTGVSKKSIMRLLLEIGRECVAHEDVALRSLKCEHVEVDELWGFCGAKDANIADERQDEPGIGSVWTWYALDADTKLIVTWIMGDRDQTHADALMDDLAMRLRNRPQISTDGLGVYASAIVSAFGWDVDYARIVKDYGRDVRDEARYSPPKCVGCKKTVVCGDPDPAHVSTSFIERANLTVRMSQRRWTRLTNAHSKSICHMEAAFALHAFHYNFCRKHATLKGRTPAMAAGVADHVWTLDELVGLLEATERRAIADGALKRGSYRPRNSK